MVEEPAADTQDSEELVFAEERHGTSVAHSCWKLLIVDDEEEVHVITRMVLDGAVFLGRRVRFLSAYSGAQAREMLREHSDVAVILLDVVMESNQAGLELVGFIREELGNRLTRIILRTGQPGQAPEREVIVRYDINDYKQKTELTAQKLFSAVTTAIRSYHDLQTLERSRKGLEQIIAATRGIFQQTSMRHFASGVLRQMTALLRIDEDGLALHSPSGFAARVSQRDISIIAGVGEFEDCDEGAAPPRLPTEVLLLLDQAVRDKTSFFAADAFVQYFRSSRGAETLLFFRLGRELSDVDRNLVQVFCGNVAMAFDTLQLNSELARNQKEIILTLGDCVESRSKETASHVRRVSECGALLATLLGLDAESVELVRLASPMHDVGKIGIPDAILLKPGKLTDEEFAVMKTHPRIGFHILKASERPIMRAAAIIAHEHHERWNGAGYPRGLVGEDIHVFGRIVCLIDVFDSLLSRRVYKEPWDLSRVLDFFRQERGQLFDPRMTDVFLAHRDEFIATRLRFPD